METNQSPKCPLLLTVSATELQWFYDMSITKLVACSGFQQAQCFKLNGVMSRNENSANGTHLWNLNETVLKTFQNQTKAVASKGETSQSNTKLLLHHQMQIHSK
jgi:hypothetical protein